MSAVRTLAELEGALSVASSFALDAGALGPGLAETPGLPAGALALTQISGVEQTAGVLQFQARTSFAGQTDLALRARLEGEGANRKALLQLERGALSVAATLDAYGTSGGAASLFAAENDPSYFQNPQFDTNYIIFAFGHAAIAAAPAGFAPDVVGAGPGLTTAWRIDAGAALAELAGALGVATTLAYRVRFANRDGRGRLVFEVESEWSATLVGLTLSLNKLSVELPLATLAGAAPYVMLDGEIQAAGLPALAIRLRLNVWSGLLEISARDLDLHLPDPAALAATLGLGALADYLPGGAVISAFALHELQISLTASPVALNNVTLAISSDEDLHLPGDLISVKPFLRLSIDAPFNAQYRRANATLGGRWTVGQSSFDALIDVSNKFFSIELARGEALDQGALTSHAMFGGVELPGLTLVDLEFDGTYTDAGLEFRGELDVLTDWTITIGGADFGLRETRIEFEYADRAMQQVEIYGWLVLAGLNFDVTAEYERGQPWLVRAASRPESVLRVGALLDRLATEFGGVTHERVNLPAAFADLAIRDLYFERRVGTADFVFQARLDHVIELGEILALDRIFLRVSQSGNAFQARGVVWLRLAGVDLTLLAEKQEVAGQPARYLFRGQLREGATLNFTHLLQDLGSKFGLEAFPDFFPDFTLTGLSVEYLHPVGEFEFQCRGVLRADDREFVSEFKIKYEAIRDGAGVVSGHRRRLSGAVTAGGRSFVVMFNAEGASSELRAVWNAAAGETLSLPELAEMLGAPAIEIPAELSPSLARATLIYRKSAGATTLALQATSAAGRVAALSAERSQNAAWRYFFALDLKLSLAIDELPVLNQPLPAEAQVALQDVALFYASQSLAGAELAATLALLPDGCARPPEGAAVDGLYLMARLAYAGKAEALALRNAPRAPQAGPSAPPAPGPQPTAEADDGLRWKQIQKLLGPVYFGRIGFGWRNGRVLARLDADLRTAALRLGFRGLGVSFPLRLPPDPEFSLDGIQVEYRTGALQISGGLVRASAAQAPGYDFRYDGALSVITPSFGLSAIGAYGRKDGKATFFAFAFLKERIGGPPAFFITGLAGGFGYNSALYPPPVDRLPEFGLIRGLLSDAPGEQFRADTSPADALATIDRDVGFSDGDFWIAVGLQFSSFEFLRSFGLLTFRGGSNVELDVLGVSRASAPPQAAHPIAFAELALEAVLKPAAGEFRAEGRLTNASYLFDRSCRLFGGFAFYLWTSGEHAGDFALTFGGYHPRFPVPAHFPRVPRLGFYWRVDGNLTIQGESYFALTPNALMAGGQLSARWESGDLAAWFDAGADFLIIWKPFHYEIDVHIRIGVSYEIDFWFTSATVTVHLGVDLELWGPPFGGEAEVDLSVFSFTISFGADRADPPPLPWSEFKNSFFPRDANGALSPVHFRVERGLSEDRTRLTGRATGDPDWIVDPGELALGVECFAPAVAVIANDATLAGTAAAAGVFPVGVRAGAYRSALSIRTARLNEVSGEYEVASVFDFERRTANGPAALWKPDAGRPGLGDARTVDGLGAGVLVRAKRSAPDVTHFADLARLLYSDAPGPEARYSSATPLAHDYATRLSNSGRTLSFTANGAPRECENFRLSAIGAEDATSRRAAFAAAFRAAGADVGPGEPLNAFAQIELEDWPQIAGPGSNA